MNYELRDTRRKSVAVGVFHLLLVAAVVLFAVSCIEKDLPRPDVNGEILALEVDGQVGAAVINSSQRTVEVVLGEAVERHSVRVSRIVLTEGGSCGIAAGDVIDLTTPQKVVVTTVSGYEWTISATQSIEYCFEVSGLLDDRRVSQVGRTHFELHSHSAFAYLPVGADLTQVTIEALKLWPDVEGVVLSPAIEVGDVVPFRSVSMEGLVAVRVIEVQYRGITETWHLYVTENDTVIESIDAFAYSVDLVAFGQGDGECGFEYRPAAGYDPDAEPATQGWSRATAETVGEGGDFSARVTGLMPSTEYLVRAFSGTSTGDIEEFSTTGIRALPGGSFDEWHRGPDDRKANDPSLRSIESWSPWPEGGVWRVNRWWDTGNKGVTFVDKAGGGNSLPDEEAGCPANPGGTAAKLQTRYAVVKVAGGNIYFGEFGEMYGINATCHLGHNWSDSKPTKLKGWFKYFPQRVDAVSEDHAALHPYGFSKEKWMGSQDTLHVCVALWADPQGRDIPFTVDTRTSEGGRYFVDFSRDKPGVIAYGAFVSAKTQADWATFEVPIEYFQTGPLPANTQLYLLITASKNCNYFIAGSGQGGGTGSLMYVDEVELAYER